MWTHVDAPCSIVLNAAGLADVPSGFTMPVEEMLLVLQNLGCLKCLGHTDPNPPLRWYKTPQICLSND